MKQCRCLLMTLFLFAGWTKQCRHLLMTVFVCRLDKAVQTFTDDPVFVCRLDKAVWTFINDCFCLQTGRSSADVYWWLFLFAGWMKPCRCLLMILFLFAGWTKQCRHLLMTFCLQAGQSSADIYWWLFVCWLDEAVQTFTDDPVFVCRLNEAVQTFIDDCFCLQAGWSSADFYWWPWTRPSPERRGWHAKNSLLLSKITGEVIRVFSLGLQRLQLLILSKFDLIYSNHNVFFWEKYVLWKEFWRNRSK